MKRLVTLSGLALLALVPLGSSSAARVPLAGSLDRSFGSAGVVTQTHGFIGAIAVQPDGKIVAAGDDAGAACLVARYLPNGSLDPSFGEAGYAENNLPSTTKFAGTAAVALQPDGKIVVAGTTGPLSGSVGSEFTLLRYDSNGSLDTSFGTNGIATTVIPESGHKDSNAVADALAVLPDGDILAAGSASWTDGAKHSSSFALVRYTPEGSLDPTFGTGGIEQTAFGKVNAQLAGIAVQPNGKIVASGWGSSFGPGNDFNTIVLARYEPGGSLDATFGTAGRVTTSHDLDYEGGPPALQDGKIVVAGEEDMDVPVLARYRTSGRLDPTFGERGFVTIPGGLDTSTPPAILVENEMILMVLPGAKDGVDAVVRFTPDGQPDPSFGVSGVASLPSSGSISLALQADGKVLADGGNEGSALVRLIGGSNCVVPGLRGKTVSKARAALATSHCGSGGISRRFSNDIARGRVVSSAPLLGARLPGGTKVSLVVSKGSPP